MKINHNSLAAELPEAWEDRTLITLVAPFAPGQFAANVVITRHAVDSFADLKDFADEQTGMMSDSLPQFEVYDFRQTEVNGVAAVQQLHRFASDHGILQQAQTFLRGRNEIIVVNCTAALSDFDRHAAAFRLIVDSLQINERD